MCQTNPVLDFAKRYNLQIETKNNGFDYLYLETDNEIILLSLQKSYELEEDNLLRFIPEVFSNNIFELNLPAECFWPSHKEDEYTSGNNISGSVDEEYYEDTTQQSFQIIKHSQRSEYSTSFFKTYHMTESELRKAVIDLRHQIFTMRHCKCAIGNVPKDYGLLEKAKKAKSFKPTTIHHNFWKISSKKNTEATFANIAKLFHIIRI